MAVQVVTIAGLNGKLGTLVTQSLLDFSSTVKIQGLVRDKSKVPSKILESPQISITEIKDDLFSASREASKGSQVVICCFLGHGGDDIMLGGQKTLIDAAIAEGVPRYIASDYALDFRKLEYGDIPAKDPMKSITTYLDSDAVKSKISGVHILNGAFTQIALYNWNRQHNQVYHWGTGSEKWDLTSYENISQYIAKIALDPSATGFIKIRGDKASFKDWARIIGEVTGTTPQTVSQGTLDELMEKMKGAKAAGVYTWDTLPWFYHYYMSTGQTELGEQVDNGRWPEVHPESVKEFVGRITKGAS